MGVWEETAIHLAPTGIAELRTDRVKSAVKGEQQKRLKVTRRNVATADLFVEQSESEILHPNCRFVFDKGNFKWYVVEEPPCLRTVFWSYVNEEWSRLEEQGLIRKLGLNPTKDRDRRRFQFAFPYIIFLLPISKYGKGVQLSECYAALRTEPLRSIDDDLFWTPFTNQNTIDGKLCVGSNKPTQAKDACEMIKLLGDHWWQSNFGRDWTERYRTYQERIPEMRTPWEWEFYSQRHPSWVLNADWIFTGMTLAKRLDAVEKTGVLQFTDIAIRARRATEILPGKSPAKTTDKERMTGSTQAILLADGRTLKIGDKLVCHTKTGSFKRGTTYEIAQLKNCSCGTCGKHVVIFANGESCNQSTLLEFFRSYEQDPTAVFQVGQHQIGAGTEFTLVNHEDIPTLRTGSYTISSLLIDQEGDARIKIQGFSNWIYITHEGTLFPSIKLKIPELIDGTFTYGEFSMKVGTAVKITNSATQILGRLLHVESITQDKDTYFIKFQEGPKRYTLFADDIIQMSWEETVYEFSDKRLKFGKNRVLDLTKHSHVLVKDQGLPLCCGKIYEAICFVHPEGKHPLDVDMLITNGNETIPVVRNSSWVFPDLYELVSTVYENDSLVLKAGEILVCQIDGILEIKKGEEVTILCFGQYKPRPDVTGIILTDGRTICLAKETPKYFVRKAKPTWTDEEVRRLTEPWFNSNREFTLGQYIANLPISLQEAFAKRKSLKGYGTNAGVDCNSKTLCIGDVVKIRNIFRYDGNGQLPVDSIGKYALVVYSWTSTNYGDKYSYIFLGRHTAEGRVNIRNDTSKFEELDPEYQGQEPRTQMAFNYNAYLEVCAFDEALFLKIEIGSPVRIRPEVNPKYGRGKVQPNEVGQIRQLLDDSTTVVDFPGESEWIGLIEELELCPFEQGQHVELKPQCQPRFMIGKAQHGVAGIFKELQTNGVVVVDFPNHSGWFGDINDIQPVATAK